VGLDVIFKRNVADALRAVACASEGSTKLAMELLPDSDLFPDGVPPERLLQVYRQGMRHALVSIGFAFGLEPVGPAAQVSRGENPPIAGLLWAEIKD
jgi:hypothetical protein